MINNSQRGLTNVCICEYNISKEYKSALISSRMLHKYVYPSSAVSSAHLIMGWYRLDTRHRQDSLRRGGTYYRPNLYLERIMWFTLLVPFLTKIFGSDGVVGKFIATKQEIQQQEQSAKLEMAKANVDLIKQQGIDAVQSEKNKLDATSQGFKFVTFVLINIPVIVMVIAPAKGKDIFENFALIPVWYAQLYAAIYGIIWGLPVAASAMTSIFGAIQQAWSVRQDKKIDKIVALGEANQLGKDAAKKEIFDTMKKAVNLNGYTQAQVDILNPVLDKILGAQTAPGTVINN